MGDLESVVVDEGLSAEFPGLQALLFTLGGLRVQSRRDDLEGYKAAVLAEVAHRHTLEGLKDVEPLRAYRDFYWRVGIDPTKVRPAAEALIRRTLGGKPIPTINTLVDAYNLASMQTLISLAAFDAAKVEPPLRLRRALPAEEFLGIGMDRPVVLGGHEVMGQDRSRPIALYPYRDADYSRVTLETKDVFLMVCGVPGISIELLLRTAEHARGLMERFCL